MFSSEVVGCGSYLPEKILSNHDIAKIVETTDEWIRERSGIGQRHVAAENEITSSLATIAAERALAEASLCAEDIDCIVLATFTPDNTTPATATKVQANIGAKKAFALDVQAACSGFAYALSVADNFIKTGQCKTALVIGAETLTRIIDWQDRSTNFLFGDGAGAVVLKRNESDDPKKSCILSSHLFSDGNYYDLIVTNEKPGEFKSRGCLTMRGKEVFKHAVNKIGQAVRTTLEKNNLTADDIDWFVPHQANLRILYGVCDFFNIPKEKMVVTIAEHANTSAASVPLALDVAIKDGRIKKGDIVLLETMGAGLTWGAALIRW